MDQKESYKIHIINNNYGAGRADNLKKYVQGVIDKYKFSVDLDVKQHKDLNHDIKKNGALSEDNVAQGYLASGGTGYWKPTGDTHKGTEHKVMKRSNRVYETLGR